MQCQSKLVCDCHYLRTCVDAGMSFAELRHLEEDLAQAEGQAAEGKEQDDKQAAAARLAKEEGKEDLALGAGMAQRTGVADAAGVAGVVNGKGDSHPGARSSSDSGNGSSSGDEAVGDVAKVTTAEAAAAGPGKELAVAAPGINTRYGLHARVPCVAGGRFQVHTI